MSSTLTWLVPAIALVWWATTRVGTAWQGWHHAELVATRRERAAEAHWAAVLLAGRGLRDDDLVEAVCRVAGCEPRHAAASVDLAMSLGADSPAI